MSKHGLFHWNELMTADADAAKDFYAELLGWQTQTVSMSDPSTPAGEGEPGYVVCMAGDQPAGGMFTMAGSDFDGMAPHWMSYIQVDDVDAVAAKAAATGGTVMREPFDVKNIGRIALIRDPQGADIGFITPAG